MVWLDTDGVCWTWLRLSSVVEGEGEGGNKVSKSAGGRSLRSSDFASAKAADNTSSPGLFLNIQKRLSKAFLLMAVNGGKENTEGKVR